MKETLQSVDERQNTMKDGDSTNPYYGVNGWLKFFVIMNLYIVPVLFTGQLFGVFFIMARLWNYPELFFVILIEELIGCFLVFRWIMIAIALNNIAKGIVQEVKKWLGISLVLKVNYLGRLASINLAGFAL